MVLAAVCCAILLFRLVMSHKKLSSELRAAENRLVTVQSKNEQRTEGGIGSVIKEFESNPDYSPNPLATGIPHSIPSPKDDPIEQEIETRQRDVSLSLGQFVTPDTKPFSYKSQFEVDTEQVQSDYMQRTSKGRISNVNLKMKESLQAHVVYNESVSEMAELGDGGSSLLQKRGQL